MSREFANPKEGNSASRFLTDLEIAWQGKLFFAINPAYQGSLTNISVAGYRALRVIQDLDSPAIQVPPLLFSALSGNVATDFRRVLLTSMPHPKEAEDPIHLVADPFCRAQLAGRLDNFLLACAQTEIQGELPVIDQLSFITNPEEVLYDTPIQLGSIEAYIELNKRKAEMLSQRVGLSAKQRKVFVREYQIAMDRLGGYITDVRSEVRNGKGSSLPPIVNIVTSLTLADYNLNRHKSGILS